MFYFSAAKIEYLKYLSKKENEAVINDFGDLINRDKEIYER